MIQTVYGTKDVLPEEIPAWTRIEQTVRSVSAAFGYSEIRTPVFEETGLFQRGIGNETDIVSKEMYTFIDRGGESITLKPEMTAAVARAYIQHSLGTKQPLQKLFYISPMFRQERPQAGRLRQFHQFGAEALGSVSPLLDAEMIILAYSIIKDLGIQDLTVSINSLGERNEREEFKSAFLAFLSGKEHLLSEESKNRVKTNVLRVLDSKADADKAVLKDAPSILDYLQAESKAHFNVVQNALHDAGIPFIIEPALVRGLDYYCKTTFEMSSAKVGAQSALCGGGRYDGLVEELGGKPTPGVGFAAGIERLILALQNEGTAEDLSPALDMYLVRLGDSALPALYSFAVKLRAEGFRTELDYLSRSVKAQMREANRLNARRVLFFGGDEFAQGLVTVKSMHDGSQTAVPLSGLIDFIKNPGN